MSVSVSAFVSVSVSVSGVEEGEMKYVSANICPLLPEGCYDVEEGYFNPDDKVCICFNIWICDTTGDTAQQLHQLLEC